MDEFKKPDHGELKNTDTFRKFFPGLYITTNFGNSTILNVNLTSLNIFYKYLDPKGSSEKTDTIRTSEFRLNITPEVTQINHIQNNNDQLLAPNDKGTFVKSPAGVNTEVTFPISEIYSKLTNRSLNQARLMVYALPEANQDEKVKLSPPDHLLLVNKDSLKGFFENRRLHDNVTSFYASFDKETYSYNFGNIAAMINYYKRQKKEAFDLTYYLVPAYFKGSYETESRHIPEAASLKVQWLTDLFAGSYINLGLFIAAISVIFVQSIIFADVINKVVFRCGRSVQIRTSVLPRRKLEVRSVVFAAGPEAFGFLTKM